MNRILNIFFLCVGMLDVGQANEFPMRDMASIDINPTRGSWAVASLGEVTRSSAREKKKKKRRERKGRVRGELEIHRSRGRFFCFDPRGSKYLLRMAFGG